MLINHYLLPRLRTTKIELVSLGDNEKYFVGNLFVVVVTWDLCVCVCVCVCVCLCVFLCISFHCKGFSWLNKTVNVMPEIKLAMLCWGNDSLSRTFAATSQTIIVGTFQLATVQECQLNQTEPREVKGNS